ncbi:sodium-coupled monocarboxylate transporter 1-like [Elysia marginata]|uniref:Sodium-coupled monocarboxylate transporter 1-like n=1 Tax=Elysia marginata TaxID=1093978 RepID=A0AAV4H6U2_9GAST|nr:sodium-coupled monocarboxylate transporter 1-like [Elysia marginata]
MAFVDDVSLIAWDYVVMAIIIAFPVVVSIWYAFRDKNKLTRSEYLLGGQRMNVIPVAMSLFVTFQSAVSLIGAPGEIYSFGTSYLLIYIGISLSYVVSAWTVVPLVYPLEVTSIYQYLDMRFHSKTLTGLITGIAAARVVCYMAIALLAPALALQASVELPLWLSILVVGGVCTLYTSMGGIKSVIWTDAFQTVIVFAGIFACIIKGSTLVGGFRNAWSMADEGGRIIFDKFKPDPRIRMTFWGTCIGGIFMWLNMAFDQASLQRIRSMKSVRAARVSTLLNIPFTLLYGTLLLNVGVVIYAYFSHIQCDPLKSKAISNKNQLAPYFVLHSMSDLPGMAGFYLATLFCGSLSTLSSGINSLAAVIVEGILSSCSYKPTERRATIITKFAVAAVGFFIVGLAFIAQYMRGPVTQMVGSINGSFGSPVVGVFLLASMVPWANKYGVASGVIASVLFMLTLTLGGQTYGALPKPLPPAPVSGCHLLNDSLQESTAPTPLADSSKYGPKFFLFDISYEWYTTMGTLFCMVIGLIVSFLTRNLIPKTDQPGIELIMHFCRRFWTSRGYIKMGPDASIESQGGLEKKHLEIEAETKIEYGHTNPQMESLEDEKI